MVWGFTASTIAGASRTTSRLSRTAAIPVARLNLRRRTASTSEAISWVALNNLVSHQPMRQRLSHVSGADKSKFFHRWPLAEDRAAHPHDCRSFLDRNFEIVGHSHGKLA